MNRGLFGFHSMMSLILVGHSSFGFPLISLQDVTCGSSRREEVAVAKCTVHSESIQTP